MHRTTPPWPPSSSAFAEVIVLRPRASRLLLAWWLALHALLLGGAALLGVAVWLRALVAVAVIAHGVLRRRRATPAPILIDADGAVQVPALASGWLLPGPRTRVGALWIELSLTGGAAGTYDILLCVDQIDPQSWSRLNARLRRRPNEGTPAGARTQTTGQADLR